MSKIEWCEATYNPTTGCRKLSAGCDNCYANTMSNRLKAMGQADYKDGFALRVHEHRLEATFSKHPFNLSKPSLVFVNSMSDLFHKDVPLDFIQRVFSLFTHPRGARHTYQILTKRHNPSLQPWKQPGVLVESKGRPEAAQISTTMRARN